MEHTYIEQFEKELRHAYCEGIADGRDRSADSIKLTDLRNGKEKTVTFAVLQKKSMEIFSKTLKSVRTETLMDCRGFVKDEELLADDKWEGTDEQRKHDMIAIIKNNERESFRTAIDNLIKKETV